jgi:hypothetical protein
MPDRSYSFQNDLPASLMTSARVKRRSRKSRGSRAIRSPRERARRRHSRMVSMTFFTAKEPTSAVSQPFARDSASSMRSTQLDEKQRQLIEPGVVSSEIQRCDYADEAKRQNYQQIQYISWQQISLWHHKFISHQHVMNPSTTFSDEDATDLPVVKMAFPTTTLCALQLERICLEAPAETRTR